MSKKVEIEIFSVDEKLPDKGTGFVATYCEGELLDWSPAAYNHKRQKWGCMDGQAFNDAPITHWFEYPSMS